MKVYSCVFRLKKLLKKINIGDFWWLNLEHKFGNLSLFNFIFNKNIILCFSFEEIIEKDHYSILYLMKV